MKELLIKIKNFVNRKNIAKQKVITEKIIEAYHQGNEDVMYLLELEYMISLGEDVAKIYCKCKDDLIIKMNEIVLLSRIGDDLAIDTSYLADEHNYMVQECVRIVQKEKVLKILEEQRKNKIGRTYTANNNDSLN